MSKTMIIFAGASALSMIRMPTLLLIAEQTLSTMLVSTMTVMPGKTSRITPMQMKSSWGYKCAPVVGLIRLGTIIQVLVSQCKVLLVFTHYNFHSIILKCRFGGGYEQAEEEVDDMEPSSSCSSPGVNPYGGDLPLELVDDSSEIDGEVGKRLNQMVPVPHVPRINGEIPSVDEATSDHQRLTDRLLLYDLVELKVQGDGNCQFRALSDQFYRSPEHHKFVRQQVISQLESHRDIYEGYVPMAYSDYLDKVSQDGEWGDHVTLQAAADMYGVKIFVITSFKDTCYIEILPNAQKSNRVIFLSFWAEVHYNSIYPEGDLPTSEAKKKIKKRWWRFRNNKHSRN